LLPTPSENCDFNVETSKLQTDIKLFQQFQPALAGLYKRFDRSIRSFQEGRVGELLAKFQSLHLGLEAIIVMVPQKKVSLEKMLKNKSFKISGIIFCLCLIDKENNVLYFIGSGTKDGSFIRTDKNEISGIYKMLYNENNLIVGKNCKTGLWFTIKVKDFSVIQNGAKNVDLVSLIKKEPIFNATSDSLYLFKNKVEKSVVIIESIVEFKYENNFLNEFFNSKSTLWMDYLVTVKHYQKRKQVNLAKEKQTKIVLAGRLVEPCIDADHFVLKLYHSEIQLKLDIPPDIDPNMFYKANIPKEKKLFHTYRLEQDCQNFKLFNFIEPKDLNNRAKKQKQKYVVDEEGFKMVKSILLFLINNRKKLYPCYCCC
jgi:hypothetical protein